MSRQSDNDEIRRAAARYARSANKAHDDYVSGIIGKIIGIVFLTFLGLVLLSAIPHLPDSLLEALGAIVLFVVLPPFIGPLIDKLK